MARRKAFSAFLLSLLRVKEGDVEIQEPQSSDDAIKQENGNWCPDVAMHFAGAMEVDERQENRKGDDVLDDKNLVTPSSDWRHGAKDNPE